MALETALWQRVKNGGLSLRKLGHRTHYCRIENSAGEGNPDVDACLDGFAHHIELKSEDRPKRNVTPIRFRVRESQERWHRARTDALSRSHWILAQVGESSNAKLYLIPGRHYEEIVMPEKQLEWLSVIDPDTPMPDVLLRAGKGF